MPVHKNEFYKDFLCVSSMVLCFSLNQQGELKASNEASTSFFSGNLDNVGEKLVNPSFLTLAEKLNNQGEFYGIMTLQGNEGNESFRGAARKIDDNYLIICEPDGTGMEKLNLEMARLSVEKNNINRELVKKEVLLENSLKKLEQQNVELEKARLEAEEATKAKSIFLANMSHEIRTPLNGIIGFTDLLVRTTLTSSQQEYAQNANTSAHLLLEIINDILDLSKIEAGKLEIDEELTDVVVLVEQTADIVKYSVSEKQIELLLDIQPGIPRFAIFDRVRLKQVLVNLLGNAIKFTQQGEVEITLKFQDIDGICGRYFFKVRDTGIGISEEQGKRLFQAFSQGDINTTKKFGGTGLGLVISNMLLDKMGSKINWLSEPDTGSEFSFELVREYRAVDDRNEVCSSKVTRVLLIDDNQHNLDILVQNLRQWNIACDTFLSGLEAEKLVADYEQYDLIIIDFHMPILNGVESINKMRATAQRKSQKLPPAILLYSSAEDLQIQLGCQSSKIEFRLSKPVKQHELLHAMNRATSSARLTSPAVKRPSEQLLCAGKKKVLVAEDVHMNYILLKNIINYYLPEAEVYEATDGEKAISLYLDIKPDFIFMDLQMPIYDGFETTKKIREFELKQRLKKTPVVALTAGFFAEDEAKILGSGMNDYLMKPLNREMIRSMLQKYLI